MTDARDISDGICAYLQGGFGNQLFIVAAAWEQANRLSCPLYIDTSRFLDADPMERAKETPRDFELQPLELPGEVLAGDSPWHRNSPRRPAAIRRLGRKSRSLKVYRQPSFNYHQEVNQVRPGTTLLGYFQSPSYFKGVAEHLSDLMLNATLTSAERATLDRFDDEPCITAHVRRGDYLTPAAAIHHGIASADYFFRAISLIRALRGRAETVRVFSDSPALVKKELAELDQLDFVDDSQDLSPMATVLAMSKGSAFAMSNSSFSWWAAWLLSLRDSSAPVVAPRPWLADGHSGHQQLLPNWMTLDAR